MGGAGVGDGGDRRLRPLPVGKLPAELLGRLLGDLGPPPPAAGVRLGPTPGEDACALDVGGEVLVVATDPITLTGSALGRMAVLVNANDVAVCGARPRWFLATVLLPPGTDEADVEAVFAGLRAGLDQVGATLVGGHTEVTPAVRQPVVVGQMLGLAAGQVVATGGAGPGDVVVQVGPAPVEGAAVLAAEAADRLGEVPSAVLAAAAAAVDDPGISVVAPALVAAGLGATALHDPTEGGLAGALHELADAAGVALVVDPDRVAWFAPGLAVCRALGADPWATLASGTLLAAFPAAGAATAVDELRRAGHTTAVIGEVVAGAGVRLADGTTLPRPRRDEVARLLG